MKKLVALGFIAVSVNCFAGNGTGKKDSIAQAAICACEYRPFANVDLEQIYCEFIMNYNPSYCPSSLCTPAVPFANLDLWQIYCAIEAGGGGGGSGCIATCFPYSGNEMVWDGTNIASYGEITDNIVGGQTWTNNITSKIELDILGYKLYDSVPNTSIQWNHRQLFAANFSADGAINWDDGINPRHTGDIVPWGYAEENFWLTGGNDNTTVGTNYIGTSDANNFEIKADNVECSYFDINYGDYYAGYDAGVNNLPSSGNQNNTLIGYGVGAFYGSFGNNCTIVGAYSRSASFANLSNVVSIGEGITPSASNYVYLGNSSNTALVTSCSYNTSVAQMSISGSTSGTIVASQPAQGASWKKVIIYCNALNGNVSYTFPTAFSFTPGVIYNGTALGGAIVSSLSTTAISLSCVGANSGFIILEGY